MQKCPVCEKRLEDPLPPFCNQCGWDLKNDLTIGAVIIGDISDETILNYKSRLLEARKKWLGRDASQETENSSEQSPIKFLNGPLGAVVMLYARIRRQLSDAKKPEAVVSQECESSFGQLPSDTINTENKNLMEGYVPDIKGEETSGDINTPPEQQVKAGQSKYDFSLGTPVPNINKDPFETISEFCARIEAYPPVHAGRGKLIKKEYKVETGVFPLKIEWEKWVENLDSSGRSTVFPYVVANRDAVKSIFESGPTYPVFVNLKTKGTQVVLRSTKLATPDAILKIKYGNESLTDYTEKISLEENLRALEKNTDEESDNIINKFNNVTNYPVGRTFFKIRKDPFETIPEFQARIDSYPPLHAGNGKLLRERYDIGTGVFPISINWKKWVKKLENDLDSIVFQYVIAEKNIAKSLYEAGPVYPVFVRLKASGGRLFLSSIELAAGDSILEVATKTFEWIEPNTGMVFVYIPGGTFMMGDVFGDGDQNEKPIHEVTLDPFYLGKFPVTQGQWVKLMENNPSKFQKGKNYPVEHVSWQEIEVFITKLHRINGNQFPFDLPTEAQWEYAARSGGRKERYAGNEDVNAVAWHKENSGGSTHPVGMKSANGFGLYDMSGNVWERCWDYYADCYINEAVRNPLGPDTGKHRVMRGGSWANGTRNCRTVVRTRHANGNRSAREGVRIALRHASLQR